MNGLLVLLVLIAILLQIRHFRQGGKPVGHYYLARYAVQARIKPAGIFRFVSPSDLRVQAVDNHSTNLWGWVVSTNRTVVATQWFRCVVTQPTLGAHRVASVEFFEDDPGWTNSSRVDASPSR